MNSLRSGTPAGMVADSRRLALKPPVPKIPKAKTPFGQIMQDFMTERGTKSEYGSERQIEPDHSRRTINVRSPGRKQISPHSFAGTLGGHILTMTQLGERMEKPVQTMNMDVSEDMSYLQALALSSRGHFPSPSQLSSSSQSEDKRSLPSDNAIVAKKQVMPNGVPRKNRDSPRHWRPKLVKVKGKGQRSLGQSAGMSIGSLASPRSKPMKVGEGYKFESSRVKSPKSAVSTGRKIPSNLRAERRISGSTEKVGRTQTKNSGESVVSKKKSKRTERSIKFGGSIKNRGKEK
jgi:hypothetical protein